MRLQVRRESGDCGREAGEGWVEEASVLLLLVVEVLQDARCGGVCVRLVVRKR